MALKVSAVGLPISLLLIPPSHAHAMDSTLVPNDTSSDFLSHDDNENNIPTNGSNDDLNDLVLRQNNSTPSSQAIPQQSMTAEAVDISTPITLVETSTNTTPYSDGHYLQSDKSQIENHIQANSTENNIATNTETNINTDKQPSPIQPSIQQQASQKITQQQALAQSLSSDDVVRSLERLAEFYQFKQPTDTPSSADALTISEETTTSELDTKDSTFNPVIAPNIYYRQPYSSGRCQGVWVIPKLQSNYKNALQRAEQQDGLVLPYNDAETTAPKNSELPLFAEADYGYYDNLSYIELSGDVKVIQGGQYIEADKLVFDTNQGIGQAQGDVLFTDSASFLDTDTTTNTSATTTDTQNNNGLIGIAEHLAYKSDGQATAQNVAFASIPMQAHGYAKQLNHPEENLYQLDKVIFSTCPPNDRKWQMEAQQIDLDTETGRGEAFDTTFRLGNVPIFYLPYFNFPIDSRRSSGFLLPRASIDTQSGVKVSVPYYFNIAPNYDATLTTQVFSNRNPMLTGEFRYLTEHYGQGELTASYLPHDKQYHHKDRQGIFFQHNWASSDIAHLTANAVYNYVSDSKYLDDFDDLGTTNSDINLPRRAEVNYYNDYLSGQLRVETFQTLDAVDSDGNPVLDKDKPYSRLPQLAIDYRLPWFNNLNITGTHNSAYFKKSINDGSENEKSGVRVYNQLSASYPLQRSWGYITPSVSLQHLYTAYDETSRLDNNIAKDDISQSVFVPKYSIDAGLTFFQSGSPFQWFDDSLGGYQLLSPRLKYVYAPYRDQNNVPNFNTRIASINYSQLFADSWFLGYDRLADNHSITPGINYRYIDAMGVTRYDASIGQQIYLDDARVTLSANAPTFTGSNSGIVWNSSAQPYQNFWFDFNGALKPNNDLNFITTQIRYQPTPRSLFNLGYIQRHSNTLTNQSALSAITASTVFPINDKWRLLAQGQYDSRNHKMIDSFIGVDYEDCCYGFSIYGRSYYNDLNVDKDPTRAIMAEFRINGFGSNSDSRMTRILSNKILGFEPVDKFWKE